MMIDVIKKKKSLFNASLYVNFIVNSH